MIDSDVIATKMVKEDNDAASNDFISKMAMTMKENNDN